MKLAKNKMARNCGKLTLLALADDGKSALERRREINQRRRRLLAVRGQ